LAVGRSREGLVFGLQEQKAQAGSSKQNGLRMLEIFSRLHWLTRGAFSAAARVLARATQSGSGF
jgi:hypothetical protein